jgi:hypothetical protein
MKATQEYFLNRPFWISGATAEVDGVPWRTVICTNGVDHWIREQNSKLWFEIGDPNYGGSVFDIAESLFLILQIKWPK